MSADSDFALDPRLDADTFAVGRLPLSRLLLMNDANYPWLILVPARANVREIFDLAAPDRATLIEEAALVGRILAAVVAADKINIAALGNVVSQLHLHVIARFGDDAAWPGPVWGKVPCRPYAAGAAAALMARLTGELAAGPIPFTQGE